MRLWPRCQDWTEMLLVRLRATNLVALRGTSGRREDFPTGA